LEQAADVVKARPHSHPLDRKLADESVVLVDGPHFGVAWCVNAPPPLPRGLRDAQLLPIDAPVDDVAAGECALVDDPLYLSSEGRFVLAWSIPHGD
jgi:hypothetical protein